MPALIWALVVMVEKRGLPDPKWLLDDFELVDPDPSAEAARLAHEQGPTWQFMPQPGRTSYTLRRLVTAPARGVDGPLGLYVPSVERNLEVFMNGEKIGDGGRLEPDIERARHLPLFFPIPTGLLRPGQNFLDVRVVIGAYDGFLERAYLGPQKLLEQAYRWQYAFKVTSMQLIMLTLALMVLFIVALWAKRPRETVYAWFAAGLLFWFLYNLNYVLTRLPVGMLAWQALIHAALGCFVYCMIVFVHRLVGLRPERLERALFWITLASVAGLLSAALVLDFERGWRLINGGYRFILLALGGYLVVRLGALCLRVRTIPVYWLASANVLTFSFGVHDSLRQLGLLDPGVPNLMQYGALAALLVFGYLLVERFADALRESEELNVDLDRKVQEKTQALAEQFERTRALERGMVLAQERERLVRDMHDGMGGQLVSLLTLIRSGQRDPRLIEDALAECLQDLRLVIDSMDTADEDLAVGLGMFRARLEPRLREMELAVHWNTHQLPAGIRLGPEGLLHVFRILQESLQNALKHARARTLWIEARADGSPGAPGIRLSVRDDGVGFTTPRQGGRGLGNMRHRADRLGATLTVDSASPGTRVTLFLPTPR
jgi:signal transduction histidine kinase